MAPWTITQTQIFSFNFVVYTNSDIFIQLCLWAHKQEDHRHNYCICHQWVVWKCWRSIEVDRIWVVAWLLAGDVNNALVISPETRAELRNANVWCCRRVKLFRWQDVIASNGGVVREAFVPRPISSSTADSMDRAHAWPDPGDLIRGLGASRTVIPCPLVGKWLAHVWRNVEGFKTTFK